MRLSNPYAPAPEIKALGASFYDAATPAVFPRHALRFRNDRAASAVGLEALSDDEWVAHFAKFEALPENLEQPLALRYHGHQFGVYNAALGDGRGFLFAQLRDKPHGRLLDLGTKGSGTTPWSRGGDGRLTLKGGVREVLATEMLEALGVKTSRTLSLFETGEALHRGDEPSPTRSSVLVRLGHSHLRFGTFQRLAHNDDTASIERLVDYTLRFYFPVLPTSPSSPEDAAVRLLDHVVSESAKLAAEWMTAGFCHGVLNTDNMNVTGESFDYGPYRFVPTFDPDFVAAYFDHQALYAFGKQPSVVAWNLSRLASALHTATPSARFESVVASFSERFENALVDRTLQRLGVAPKDATTDSALAAATWAFLAGSGIGFESLFFDLYGGLARETRARAGPSGHVYEGERYTKLRDILSRYAPRSQTLLDEPYFQCDGPITLLIDEIEAIWQRIASADDWSLFNTTISDIRAMGAALSLPARI